MNLRSDQKSIDGCDKEGEGMVKPDGVGLEKERFYTRRKE